MHTRVLNVLEMAQGAVMEQIVNESTKIMANVLDPNTKSTATRKMTITLTFHPNDARDKVTVEAQAKSTLAPRKAVETSFFVAEDDQGNPHAREITNYDPNQETIFVPEEEKVTNVLQMRSVK